jgi:signal transduction histidine kinase
MTLSAQTLAFARLQAEATMLLSPHGTILFANQAARDALALAGDSSPETLAAISGEDVGRLQEYLRICSRSTEPLPGSFTVRRPSTAEPESYRCKTALLLPGESVLVCQFIAKAAGNPFVLLNQTIAELTEEVRRRREAEEALRKSESELRERAVEAEGANHIKDEFLAALSHELRTPLNAILGWTLMLRQGLSEERRARAIDTIERNARAQVQLIEELLDVSRIVSGKLRLNVQHVDPSLVVENALETVRLAAEAKGVRIHSVLDPLAGPISGDPDRLQQVLWNIVSNAVKFTPKGGRVEVLLERVDSDIELTITDTGQGIAPAFLPFVFDRFRQAEGSTTRSHGGLGLGLSIAKSIVELHGGSVRASSGGEGHGASFVIRLPRSIVVRQETPSRPFGSAGAQPPIGACPPSLDGLRIVIVDDEPDALQLLSTILEGCGASVRAAGNAAGALELVRAFRPEVLVSDIGMPREDGYTLIQKVRALPPEEGGQTHAIALTAYARTSDRTRALTAGFHSHVPKPVEPNELFAVIASLVGRR